MSEVPDVLVVGAGVSGLTTAICLAEEGLSVSVRADLLPRDTTSAVAGAIWGPHLAERSERADGWAGHTLTVLRDLAGDPAAGIRMTGGCQASRGASTAAGFPAGPGGPAAPPGGGAELGARVCSPAELPAGFTHGWRYTAPLVHMPTYLDYLSARLERAGVRIQRHTVTSLASAGRQAGARAVVNCTGAGAGALAGDPDVIPVRGQIVVAANPGVREFFIGLPDDSSELIYIFPHGDVVVLGGTETAGDASLVPDPAAAGRILRDCAIAEPRLSGAPVIAHRVGLRPFRPRVRLEAEHGGERPARQDLAGRPREGEGHPLIVHNYGHGGAGVTLSWGCAREAAALVAQNIS